MLHFFWDTLYKPTKWGWTRLSKQIATNPHDAKGGKYPGKLQLQPNIWGNPKLNLPHILHNPKLLELYRNGYALGPLEQPGGRRFYISQKIDIYFQCVIKGITAFKSNQEKWQWNGEGCANAAFFKVSFPWLRVLIRAFPCCRMWSPNGWCCAAPTTTSPIEVGAGES